MSERNPHRLLTCPYNMSHQIEAFRMHIHLQKCRKQHPHTMTTCPFDTTHTVSDMELDYHISVCPKRAMFDTQIYVTDDEHRPVANVEPPKLDLPQTENWDDDNVTSYQPAAVKKGAPIIMKPKGMTPAERRRARMEGRLAYVAASKANEINQ